MIKPAATMPTTQSLLASMAQNPRYQETVARLASAPSSVRAILDLSEADEAYMNDTINRINMSNKLAAIKQSNDLTNMKQGISLDAAQFALNRSEKNSKVKDILGAGNTLLSAYGLFK